MAAVIARGPSLADAFHQLSPGLTPDQVEQCVIRYRVLYPEIDIARSVLYDGVQSTLQRLHDAGICIVVLSNKGRAAVEAAVARFGLTDSVRYVLADEPGQPTKPDPDVFYRRVVGLFGARPSSNYLVVGDTEADLRFARAVGIRSCWATYGYGDRDACRGACSRLRNCRIPRAYRDCPLRPDVKVAAQPPSELRPSVSQSRIKLNPNIIDARMKLMAIRTVFIGKRSRRREHLGPI
jgi:HAD superfamily hydrolase (TIGR01509 family)